ncbi:MAG: hypothetical protein BM560_20125 [Roseobacter sp. MedPE-SWde]|nr:MAG: hypothetical protein BM560_20125 [Roseobacter sp. MedPE-SWde]
MNVSPVDRNSLGSRQSGGPVGFSTSVLEWLLPLKSEKGQTFYWPDLKWRSLAGQDMFQSLNRDVDFEFEWATKRRFCSGVPESGLFSEIGVQIAKVALLPEDSFSSDPNKSEGAETDLDAFSVHLKKMVESAG